VDPAAGGAAQATKGACKGELWNVRAIVQSPHLCAPPRQSATLRATLQSATRQRRLQPRLEPGRDGERNEKV
jgi:hypothetical protein